MRYGDKLMIDQKKQEILWKFGKKVLDICREKAIFFVESPKTMDPQKSEVNTRVVEIINYNIQKHENAIIDNKITPQHFFNIVFPQFDIIFAKNGDLTRAEAIATTLQRCPRCNNINVLDSKTHIFTCQVCGVNYSSSLEVFFEKPSKKRSTEEINRLMSVEEYQLENGYIIMNGTDISITFDNGITLKANPGVAKLFKIIHLNDVAFQTGKIKFLIPTHASKKDTQEYIDKMYADHKIIFIVSQQMVQAYERTISIYWKNSTERIALSNQFLTNTSADGWRI